jgi:N-acetylmuramoyl-L-alanine amidase
MSGNIAATDVAINMDTIDNLREVTCLSQAVHGEASNQPMQGKIAVAYVIMNRTTHSAFPDTPCGVVKQPGQFDYSKTTRLKQDDPAVKAQMEDSVKAALLVLNGEVNDPTRGSLYFANPKTATDQTWLSRLKKIVRIKDHVFYALPAKATPSRYAASAASEKSL